MTSDKITPGRAVSLQDAIVACLRQRPEGVSSHEVAERFLRLTIGRSATAAVAVAALLGADRRCFADESGLWHACRTAARPAGGAPLRELPWSAVYVLTDPGRRRALYFALWEISPELSCRGSGWLVDPQPFAVEERDMLCSGADAGYVPDTAANLLAASVRGTAGRIPVFLSSVTRDLVVAACAGLGESFTDDTVIARELVKAADIMAPRALTLDALEAVLLGAVQPGASARKQGERFAIAIAELIGLLGRSGIESREDLDARIGEKNVVACEGKSFSYSDLLSLPARPGVYGFKDREGAYIYIGKTNNLKRRLSGYFGDSDESPAKIEKLREQAYAVVTHSCGSELECLLHEYRLIWKHAPLLNRNIAVNERTGSFRPIGDCIVLLPHDSPGKAMTVWYRENQKILLKSISLHQEGTDDRTVAELNAFFMGPRLPASPTDFPEQEIATRWIKRHADELTVVPVSRMASAEEIDDALGIALRDFCEKSPAPEQSS